MNHSDNFSDATNLVHHERVSLPLGNQSLVTPLHQSVKYTPKSMAQFRAILCGKETGFIYSRVCNPTVRELEILMAKLQGRDDAIATSSGIAAITAVAMSFLKAGDRVLMFTESYKPTRFLLGTILKQFGIETIRLSRDDYHAFESHLSGPIMPRAIFLESPTNPALRIHDLEWITSKAKAAGVITVLDNTFAGLLANRSFPIDIYVHSLTKQACGHSDAMGGVIVAQTDHIKKIFPVAMTLGGCLDPHSAWLILRGMKTYHLRTSEAARNAANIASWLTKQNWAKNVRYPALPCHPDHKLWLKQCEQEQRNDGGAVVTFDLDVPGDQVDCFFDHLKIFAVAPSLGCVESLAAPCLLLFGEDLPATEATAAGITEKTVRLAVGIENVDDLKNDIAQAATAARQSNL